MKETSEKYALFEERDHLNYELYGEIAPFYQACIHVNPTHVNWMIKASFPREDSGKVVSGDWDRDLVKSRDSNKYKFCHRHFVEGCSWEEAGVYEYYSRRLSRGVIIDNLHNLDEVYLRYKALDQLYEDLKRGLPFEAVRSKTCWRGTRCRNGIYIHVDREGMPIFGGAGYHRLAIAQILGLAKVPAQLGVVHKLALERGLWTGFDLVK